MYDIKQSETQTHWGGRPIGAPPKAVPVFLIIYIMNIYGYSLYIPYIFHIYIYIYIFPKYVPYIFPCVFLNSWSQQ